jgi:hypothetical protein
MHTTCNQVKTIRLKPCWRHRGANALQKAEHRRDTFKEIGGLPVEGPSYSGGRDFVEKLSVSSTNFEPVKQISVRLFASLMPQAPQSTGPGRPRPIEKKNDPVPADQPENVMYGTYEPIDLNLMLHVMTTGYIMWFLPNRPAPLRYPDSDKLRDEYGYPCLANRRNFHFRSHNA